MDWIRKLSHNFQQVHMFCFKTDSNTSRSVFMQNQYIVWFQNETCFVYVSRDFSTTRKLLEYSVALEIFSN